jgi:putative membrane protein
MFLEITIAILIGISAGIITGLTPGIHINLISVLVLSASAILFKITSPLSICAFIIAMAITHTFLDSIPGIYLGAPDASQALNVLPGHRLLLKGLGHNAVIYTLIGSIGALLLALILFPIFLLGMKTIYPIVKAYIGFALIAIMCYMIGKEKSWQKRFNSLLVFLIAGTLGLIVLNMPTLKQPLFPLLSGLFGFSILILSLTQKSTIPKQDYKAKLTITKKNTTKAISAATGVGFIAAFLPGFGSSQAAIIATNIVGDIGDEGFLSLVGGINTANMLISIATAYTLNKARNGAIIAVNTLIGGIDLNTMLTLLTAALIAGGIAAILAVNISKTFAKLVTKISYAKIILTILAFITILTFIFDGFLGIIILTTSTAVGILTSQLGVGKNHLMGCLILPVILFFVL